MISYINHSLSQFSKHPPRPVPEALWVGEKEWREPGEEAAVQPV